jgi:hypothetical protein
MVTKRKRPARARKASAVVGNGLKAPAPLTAAEQKFWDEVVVTTPGLKPADTVMCYAWVRLAARFVSNPSKTSINALRHMNQIGNRLGFSPTQRKRIGLKAQRKLAPTPVEGRKRFRFDYFGDGSGGDV